MIWFGERLPDIKYRVREGAYGILINDRNELAIAWTPRGSFLPGGGIDEGESHEECTAREFAEEVGVHVSVEDYFMSSGITGLTPNSKQYLEMKGHYYFVSQTGETGGKIEEDHVLKWVHLEEAPAELWLPNQALVIQKILDERIPKVVRPFNRHWKWWFEAIVRELPNEIYDCIERIEHVGSTSIEGMLAKPVIDIDMVLKEGSSLQACIDILSRVGYSHNGNQGIVGREAFKRKVDGPQNEILDGLSHHLYVCHADNPELLRHLRFRDKLRADSGLVDAYNDLKREILNRVGWHNRKAYVAMKEENGPFFNEIIGG